MLQICDTLDIYGVGTTAFKEKVPNWHYFENHRFHSSREFGSDPHHSFALEHEALLLLNREKVVIHHPLLPPGGTSARTRLKKAVSSLPLLREKRAACTILKGMGVRGKFERGRMRKKRSSTRKPNPLNYVIYPYMMSQRFPPVVYLNFE